MANTSEKLLTPDQLAEFLNVKRRTVSEWARTGVIPQVTMSPHVRRFRLSDVLNALEGRGQKK